MSVRSFLGRIRIGGSYGQGGTSVPADTVGTNVKRIMMSAVKHVPTATRARQK